MLVAWMLLTPSWATCNSVCAEEAPLWVFDDPYCGGEYTTGGPIQCRCDCQTAALDPEVGEVCADIGTTSGTWTGKSDTAAPLCVFKGVQCVSWTCANDDYDYYGYGYGNDDSTEGGCSCASGPGGGWVAFLTAGALLVPRRRRR